MAMYTLPQSLVVPPHENKIPSFALIIHFVEGVFSEHTYSPSNVNALWTLVGTSASMSENFFFEIERKDEELKLQGCFAKNKFCLFRDSYNSEINFFNQPQIDFNDLKLSEITDARWDLIYFIPEVALMSFKEMVEVGNRILQSGNFGDETKFPQSFKELGLPNGYC